MTKEERLSLEKPGWKEILKAVPFTLRFIRNASPGLFYGLFALAIVSGPLSFLSVYAIKDLTDAVSSGNLRSAFIWGAVLVVASLMSGSFFSLQGALLEIQRFRLENEMEDRALRHTSSLPYKTLEDPSFLALAMAFDQKSYTVKNFQTSGMRVIQNVSNVVGLAASLIFVPWIVLVFVILSLCLMSYLLVRYNRLSWGILQRETREGRRALYIRDLLRKPRSQLVAKTMDLQLPFLKRWQRLVDTILTEKIAQSRKNLIVFLLSSFLEVVGFAAGLVVLVPAIMVGSLAVSAFVVFLSVYQRLSNAIENFSWNMRFVAQESGFLVVFKRFFETELEPDMGKKVPKEPLVIRFEDVWFRYPGTSVDVLRGFNLAFTEGEHIALVGLNGAGKSTMLKLLMGTYAPTKGRITVNNVDLATIKPSEWRKALAVLMQDDVTFDDVVREQVKYGNYTAKLDERRFQQALAASGLADVVKDLPRGLDTHAGKYFAMTEDEPIELSGGQRQIVAIARTLYRSARVYVFDEPTSNVDAEKEERFFQALPDVLQSHTALFVSHRFSTLRRAERIIAVDNGRVIEDGRHEDLLMRSGRYAELFALQAKSYQ